MNISDIKVFIRDNNQLKAFVNMVIDDAFIIRNIKVIEGQNGLFIAMPSRKTKSGEYRDIAHPINTETRNKIEEIIIAKYKETLEEALTSADEKPAEEDNAEMDNYEE